MSKIEQLQEFHWMIDMLQSIDAGLVVLDSELKVQVWNSFMENNSGILSNKARDASLFELFPELPKDWFEMKVSSVFQLKTRAFSIWEQRPYLFRFNNNRPITGNAEFMYQNISIIPLTSSSGNVDHVCIIVYDVTDVALSRQALESVNLQLKDLSRTDRLTGLNNRGYWTECHEAEFAKYLRHGYPTSLVMFDIDHFKKVNDTYGHQAGDDVIRMCSKALLKCARDIDICGRYGGEEFVVILENTTASGAKIFAERLRQVIEKLTINTQGYQINFTISLGIAELSGKYESPEQWLQASDEALYHSKENGRNMVSIAE